MQFVIAVVMSAVVALSAISSPRPEVERPADAVIALIAWWQPGEVRYVEVVKGKREFLNDTTTSEEVTRILYSVRVLEETDTSYTLRWDILDAESNDDDDYEPSEALLARFEEEGIRIRTTELGMWIEIENLDLLADTVGEMVRSMEDYHLQPELGEEIVASMTSPDAIVELILPEIALFYALHGYEFPLEKGWEYTELLPHYLGGSPMLAKGFSRITEIDEDEGYFTLENTLTVDGHELLQMTASLYGPEFTTEAQAQEMSMAMEDRKVFHIDFFTGWTQSVDRTRITSIDWRENDRDHAMRTEEFTNIRLVDAPEGL